jgi:two-component system CheB/CheR fusion protein
VVDDEEDVSDALAALLESRGHRALAVHDGLSGLAAVQSFRPDVALVDIGMPGMDGYQVARQIREQHDHEQILLIAMTGYQKDQDRLDAAGFDRHLLKPPDLEKLARWLAQAKVACANPG